MEAWLGAVVSICVTASRSASFAASRLNSCGAATSGYFSFAFSILFFVVKNSQALSPFLHRWLIVLSFVLIELCFGLSFLCFGLFLLGNDTLISICFAPSSNQPFLSIWIFVFLRDNGATFGTLLCYFGAGLRGAVLI